MFWMPKTVRTERKMEQVATLLRAKRSQSIDDHLKYLLENLPHLLQNFTSLVGTR